MLKARLLRQTGFSFATIFRSMELRPGVEILVSDLKINRPPTE